MTRAELIEHLARHECPGDPEELGWYDGDFWYAAKQPHPRVMARWRHHVPDIEDLLDAIGALQLALVPRECTAEMQVAASQSIEPDWTSRTEINAAVAGGDLLRKEEDKGHG